MLYRTPGSSIATRLRGLLARLGGALAELRKTAADTASLDGLTDRELRELGLRRYDDRHSHQDGDR